MSVKLLGFEDKNVQPLKQQVANISKMDARLSDVTYVYLMPLEFAGKQKEYTDFAGLDIAKQEIAQDYTQKIALVGILSLAQAAAINENIRPFLTQKNTSYIDYLGGSTEELAQQVLKDFEQKNSEDFSAVQSFLTGDNARVASRFLHDIRYVPDVENPKNDQERSFLEGAMNLAKGHFPSLKDKTNTETLEFIKSIKIDLPETMKGETVDGVYCDVEGTLLIEGEVNENLLKALEVFKTEGKEVTLWTMGQTELLQKTLNEKGIAYPLKSKLEFTGAIAEIVIDDEDRNTFIAKTRIQPKEFIKADKYSR